MKPIGMVLLCATLVANTQEQAPRFAVAVDAVQVDVQVTRRGRPVAGLTAADFELTDNGVAQRIDSVTREDVPLDLFLVLDASASVAGQPLRELSNAARIAVEALGSSDRISLLTFTHRVNQAARLSTERGPVFAAIDGMRASGATSLFDAVYAALVLRNDAASRALVIAFTDGHDSSSWLPPSAVLEVAKQTDVVVYGVTLAPKEPASGISLARSGPDLLTGRVVVSTALRTDEPPAFLDDISSITGGRVFHTENPRKLGDLFRQAVREMKSRYVLSYTPRGVAPGGWHSLEVKLTRRTGDVTARRGYFVASAR